MADISSPADQIKGFEYWAEFWNTARIWLTAATAIVAFFVFAALYISNHYSEKLAAARKIETQEKEAQRQKENEQANKEIELAKATAAKANEAAIEAKTAQQKVEIELAKQREKTAKAEKELELIKRQMGPPKIPQEFSDALKPVERGRAVILYRQGDAAGLAFGNELLNIFKARGWAAIEPRVGDPQLFTRMDSMFSPRADDITIVANPKFGPEPNLILRGPCDAFRNSGFQVAIKEDMSVVAQDITIIINPKPGGPRSWRRV